MSPSFETPTAVHPIVMAHLLAHIFNNNYTILSTFPQLLASGSMPSETDLREKLGELTVRRGEALPLLWAYLWGLDEDFRFDGDRTPGRDITDTVNGGSYERTIDPAVLSLTMTVLSVAAQNSHANLLTLRQHLPELPEFLVARLYGRLAKRKYETTFPPRDDWCDDLPDPEDVPEWYNPDPDLRGIYLSLLRKILDGGVDQIIVWRLFSLIKVSPSQNNFSSQTSEAVTPALQGIEAFPIEPSSASTLRPMPKKRPRPGLHISTTMRPRDEENLQPEILDLIRHCIKSRWPSCFVMRGGSAGQEGGIELADMGRSWPLGPKGFNFSVSDSSSAR